MNRHILLPGLFLIATISGFCYAQTSADSVADISLSPFQDFQDHCSNCHGNEGSDYDKSFKTLSDKKLRDEVEGMMFGPAFLTPTKEEIKAMVAYNKAIQKNVPFAIITNAQSFSQGKDDTLRISASSGSRLSFNNQKGLRIIQQNNEWKVVLDSKNIGSLLITVSRNNSSAAFEYPAELWSR